MNFSQYANKNIKEVFDNLNTQENGLSEKEAEVRLKTFGFNEIKSKKVGLFDIFKRQFKSPFFYLLFIASVIAFLINEKIDGFLILLFVLINVFLSFFQEFRAEKAALLLKKYIPSKARVLREGIEKTIDKKFLAPGDIVLLEAGNIVPADLRIIKTENFLVDESILTGESFPVSKISQQLSEKINSSIKTTKLDAEALYQNKISGAGNIFEAKNIVFSGTSIISGAAEGIVIGTAKNTVFNEIAKLVLGINRESTYEKSLLKFSSLILKIVVSTIIFVFLANLIIKGTENFSIFLIFCIALIVSIIPEALPVVITFALSNGALKLARKKVIVKRLSAVEDLGNIEILCTDKTGTLTENKLQVENIYAQNKKKCLLYGLLLSSYLKEEIESSLNPFDSALFEKATKEIRESLKNFRTISDIPFDSNRLRNSAIIENQNGKMILIVKGAPEIILKLSSKFENGSQKEEVEKQIEKEGKEGKRILAVAFKEFDKKYFSKKDEKDFTFLGYFSFKDPLKETSKESIEMAKKLGIKIKMITGDSKEVAGHIAKEIDLINDPKKVILGEQLNSLSENDFEKTCQEFSVFARISPETKLKIIQELQKKFEVGFLGEGINDTPALKIANVGIVVHGAADVSREVADVILVEKNLKVIIDGIKNGRKIFSNINKYIKCILISNFGNFYSIAIISLFIKFLPMLPIQILLGNLLSDFPLIAIATDHVETKELKKPKLYQLSQVIWLIVFLALISTIFDFIFFAVFYKIEPGIIQTLWFIESILTEIFLIFLIRTRHFFLKTKRPSFSLMFFTFLDAILIIILPFTNFGREFFHFVSPPISSLLIVFFLVFSYFIISEIVKLIYFRRKKTKTYSTPSAGGQIPNKF